MYDMVRSNMTCINFPLYVLSYALVTMAFTLKRAPSNLLKWHHIRYDMEMLKPYCLFLKFGYMRNMFDILKTPNQISATLLRLFQNVCYLYHYTKAKLFVVK